MSTGTVVSLALTALIVIGGGVAGCPYANVHWQRMEGEAQLAKAESTRRTKVLEARAELDSADLRAEAEVKRAQGVAKANAIMSESLGGPEGYLRWKYIEMLENTGRDGRDVIYVPTEAALPILEAGKRPQPQK